VTALLNRVATALDHRLSRRGFLAKSALAGTAMAVAPTDYLLKPVGAYQAICNCSNTACDCGSMCCDGYTEFCCTLTGINRCPPGHVLGGWWKVDNSSFCSNGPRYYMDCNAPCNGCGCGSNGVCSGSCSGTTCGCARGWCGYRKSGCVNFRYGQCNQGTACIGPIVCRVVTCVPPWTLDSSCTRTVAVDDYTAFHSAPCLSRPYGYLDELSPAPGGVYLRGWVADPETTAPIVVRVHADGQMVQQLTADRPRPDVATVFPGIGPNHGFEATIPLPKGRYTITVYAINVLDGSENPVVGSAPVGVGVPFGMADMRAGVGAVRLTGWVIDPQHREPASVRIHVDGAFVGAWPANVYRNDVAAAYSRYGGEHGFDIQIAVAPGTRRVEAWMPDIDGVEPPFQLAAQTLSVPDGYDPMGFFDSAMRVPAGIRVIGWAADADSGDPLDIHAYVDGVFAGSALANRARPDVQAVFPNFGPNRGFDFTVPAIAGTRQVSLYAIGKRGGAPSSLLGTQTVVVGNLPYGFLDSVSDDAGGVRVVGWTIDPDAADRVDVLIYVDGVFAGLGRTGVARPDVDRAYPGYGGYSGFDFVVPAAPGRRTVCAYAIDTGDSSALTPMLGCFAVTLS